MVPRKCWLKTSGAPPGLPSGDRRNGSRWPRRTQLVRSGECAGSLKFPLAVGLKPNLLSDRKRAAFRHSESCEQGASGPGAELCSRARTGSVALAAIDVEDVTGDE